MLKLKRNIPFGHYDTLELTYNAAIYPEPEVLGYSGNRVKNNPLFHLIKLPFGNRFSISPSPASEFVPFMQ